MLKDAACLFVLFFAVHSANAGPIGSIYDGLAQNSNTSTDVWSYWSTLSGNSTTTSGVTTGSVLTDGGIFTPPAGGLPGYCGSGNVSTCIPGFLFNDEAADATFTPGSGNTIAIQPGEVWAHPSGGGAVIASYLNTTGSAQMINIEFGFNHIDRDSINNSSVGWNGVGYDVGIESTAGIFNSLSSGSLLETSVTSSINSVLLDANERLNFIVRSLGDLRGDSTIVSASLSAVDTDPTSQVPSPATLGLMGLGLLVLTRRRNT